MKTLAASILTTLLLVSCAFAETTASESGESKIAPIDIPRITKAECISKMNTAVKMQEPRWILQLTKDDMPTRVLDDERVHSESKSRQQRLHARFITYVRSKIEAGAEGKNQKPKPILSITPREFIQLTGAKTEWENQFSKWSTWTGCLVSAEVKSTMQAVADYAATPAGQAEDATERAFAAEVGTALEAYQAFLEKRMTAEQRATLHAFAEQIRQR